MVSALVGVIMGSKSDLEVMSSAGDTLAELQIAHELRIVSAHRTPDWMVEYAKAAEGRGLRVIIAAAGGAAHLPGMVAALTAAAGAGRPHPRPRRSTASTRCSPSFKCPRGRSGRHARHREDPALQNAALLAAEILALQDPALRVRLLAYREARRDAVLAQRNP